MLPETLSASPFLSTRLVGGRILWRSWRRYPSNVPGIVTGIGLVNLGHCSGKSGDFLPLNFWVYAPGQDGLTKNDHFQAMFARVVADGTIQARILLFDSWHASSENLKVIHRAGWMFFTTLKSNRLVNLGKEMGCQAPNTLELSAGGWSRGVNVRLKQVSPGSNSLSWSPQTVVISN